MILEALIAIALLGGLATFLAPDEYAGRLAAAISLLPLGGSLYAWRTFDGTGNALLGGQMAFETDVAWFELGGYAIDWHVGVDGISLPLVVLATFLTTAAIASAWSTIDERESQFYGLVLVLEAAMIGVFVAMDFIIWFVFWEGVLVPMYILIGVWGGDNRRYAAIKFLIYTNVASLVAFVGVLALFVGLPEATFGLPELADGLRSGALEGYAGIDAATLTLLAFVATFAGFAVKVPLVPVHTWLPDAHVEAPTPASVLLAGVLLKMGTYALLRFNVTMMPETMARLAVPIAILAVVSVLYGALLALAQNDLKRIVAYSSISSMGYVLLGLVALSLYGLGGATFQMVSHGLISGALFMIVGVIYHRTHTRDVETLSGLADRMPLTAAAFVAAAFAYMGLPLMSGFAAELFVFIGGMQSAVVPLAPLVTAVAMFGIVVVAGYLLWAMQRTLFGPAGSGYPVDRASARELVPIGIVLAAVIALGVAPDLFWPTIQRASAPVLQDLGEVATVLGGGL
ncbi:complex I subunit 4 family protein [Halococcoides cellulosivorans]|uniref:Oxidoreductase n=1 Tax=Halococcoides cellulosivorans TaxID=1679096 RepID=A0A2R4WZX2_9EURY|nr:NuoM family protein [Halococcoides cellulosivorans]AWB27088.1 oxidoreductase [Halococcoides cellulosivorans]